MVTDIEMPIMDGFDLVQKIREQSSQKGIPVIALSTRVSEQDREKGKLCGFDYHLENHLRETYKYLIKMDDLHEVQKAMMRFVRSLGDIYPHELKTAFVKLHMELKQYEEDPYERRAFLYLDILQPY